jgi:hypothetical protein
MFRDTFNPYRPAVIDWPKLDPPALERLVTLPIWNIAVQTEGKARLRMLSYAEARSVGDIPAQDNNFTVTGTRSVSGSDVKVGPLMAICLEEDDRRFAGYDARPLRPTTVPRLAKLTRRLLGG